MKSLSMISERKFLPSTEGDAAKVFDPFSGGGAIPFEAMRLGCDVTASDLNPVAWFILKCTLDYPKQFEGKTMAPPQLRPGMARFHRRLSDRQGKETEGHQEGRTSQIRISSNWSICRQLISRGTSERGDVGFLSGRGPIFCSVPCRERRADCRLPVGKDSP